MRVIIALMDSVFPVVRALFAIIWAEMVSRTTGPFPLRFLLQPLLASALAICDTRAVRAPFLTGVLARWIER